MALTVDLSSELFVVVLLVLTVLFRQEIPNWTDLALQLTVAGALYFSVVYIIRILPRGSLATAVHIGSVMALFSFLFGAVSNLQHVFIAGWMDQSLVGWETALFGGELSVHLQAFASPVLTEWMMFAYVIYIPLLPLIGFLCWCTAGSRGAVDYLMNLSLANILCYAGFIVFPIAGPLSHYPDVYSVPLDGGLFTWCGEWVRSNLHYPGGSLPSPHCAAATVMLAMLFRYNHRLAWPALPVILTLYIATVYGRYHYTSDMIAGILTGLGVLRISPRIAKLMDRAALEVQPVTRFDPESVAD